MNEQMTTAVILISGRGSNMQAIIQAVQQQRLALSIKAVISNRPQAAGLQMAHDAGIPTSIIDHTEFSSRQAFDHALQTCIDQYQPDLVILAGFMRILGNKLVTHYLGRMLNIHPSLLPKYPGLNTHQQAIDNHDERHGASVHFVTTELDGGPVVIQVSVAVLPDDTAESLANRVLQQEHRIYCQAIEWYANGRLKMIGQQAYLDNKPLQQPYQLTE